VLPSGSGSPDSKRSRNVLYLGCMNGPCSPVLGVSPRGAASEGQRTYRAHWCATQATGSLGRRIPAVAAATGSAC